LFTLTRSSQRHIQPRAPRLVQSIWLAAEWQPRSRNTGIEVAGCEHDRLAAGIQAEPEAIRMRDLVKEMMESDDGSGA
jgi:hypothetical protein